MSMSQNLLSITKVDLVSDFSANTTDHCVGKAEMECDSLRAVATDGTEMVDKTVKCKLAHLRR